MKDLIFFVFFVALSITLAIIFKIKFSYIGIIFSLIGLIHNNFIYKGDQKLKTNGNFILIFTLLGNLFQIIFKFEVLKNPFIVGNE